MCPEAQHNTVVNSPPEKVFYDLLTSTEFTNLILPNYEVLWVFWKHSEENVTTGKNVNVAVAAHVTTKARLEIYEYLRELGDPVLYCVTDSMNYVQKVSEPETNK